jgi:hypothetical protein
MSIESLSISIGIPGSCGPFPLPSGSYATASLLSIAAQVLSYTPFQTATVRVSLEAAIAIFNFYGVRKCTFTGEGSAIANVPTGHERPDVAIRSATIISSPITESFQASSWRPYLLDDTLVDLSPADPFVRLEILADLVLSQPLGICPTDATGAPLCPPFNAKDCILVNKVYDQCFTEELVSSRVPVSSTCPGISIPAGATVACSPVPGSATCTFAGTVAVTPPLTPFFQEVQVINSFDVSTAIIVGGVTVCSPTLTLTGVAQADLWVPPGTTVNCDILAFGDCTCTLLASPTGLPVVLTCTGKICKEVQITAPVKLLVPTYGFCELPACDFLPQPGFVCPPVPLFPPERCQDSPTVTLLGLAAPISGVAVSIYRVGLPLPVATATTGPAGTASFPAIGGLEGAIDVVQFTFLGKTVLFSIPIEFDDVNGIAHDSATTCSLVFTQTGTSTAGAPIFTVTINGFQEAGTVDPE